LLIKTRARIRAPVSSEILVNLGDAGQKIMVVFILPKDDLSFGSPDHHVMQEKKNKGTLPNF